MTPAELEALARRAVACRHWRWMPGMLMHYLGADPREAVRYCWDDDTWFHGITDGGTSWIRMLREKPIVPVLTDPATLGWLLALVREAWPGCYAEPNGAPEWDGIIERERDSWWRVYGFGRIPRPLGYGPTEAAALVAALEAAP